jgi:hypothetical protein
VRLKNSSDIQNKLVKHQVQDLNYTQEILKAQAVESSFGNLVRAVMSKDLKSTKQHLDELKTFKRLDRIKDVIDKDNEWTLLHHSANQNSI